MAKKRRSLMSKPQEIHCLSMKMVLPRRFTKQRLLNRDQKNRVESIDKEKLPCGFDDFSKNRRVRVP